MASRPFGNYPMSSLLKRFWDRWTYARLSSYSDRAPARTKPSRWRRWAALGIVLAVAAILWFGISKFIRSRYNPLDDYQNINPLPVTVSADLRHPTSSRRAVVSILESDGYAIGVAVLGHSVRAANVNARMLLPYIESRVSAKALCIARAVGWEPYPVLLIPPPHGGKHIYTRFMEQYTKLNIWNLDQKGVDSAVYLDADTLVRGNFDELFDLPFHFGAVPDVRIGWDPRAFSITFNAGVLAFRPSSAVYENMRQQLEVAKYPLEEAEQAFLNLYFGGTCVRLPYIYNANLAIKARSPILWERLADEMRIVHFTRVKPFLPDLEVSTAILTSEEIATAMDKAARFEGGHFQQEVGWWKEAYNRLMVEYGHAMAQCQ
ncbi:glycosyltransferase family 8 protein [Mycena galopus ATCC 62051]|nr:glycosyltransferase family 8 protein [Mycena galopus ATCC 62051]